VEPAKEAWFPTRSIGWRMRDFSSAELRSSGEWELLLAEALTTAFVWTWPTAMR
jgi:hypothetical protein